MEMIKFAPKVHAFNTFKDFQDEFQITKKDLVLTNEYLYEPFMKPLGIEANYLFQEKYGTGEPTDTMINAIHKDADKLKYNRVIAFGGGTIIDIAKIFVLKMPKGGVEDLVQLKAPVTKEKELIIIPTTCGTGSEMTNISIVGLEKLGIKKGLANDAMFADHAILMTEPLRGLPFKVFATSSIDALIHATESYLSPKSTPFTEPYSLRAMRLIMDGYKEMVEKGPEARLDYLQDFMVGSCLAGVAFGTAGCAAVHALSYSIGGAFHVPHGEANYQFFTEVFRLYAEKNPNGRIKNLTHVMAEIMGCDPEGDVFGELEKFLDKIISRRPLREYGMTETQIDEFTDSTIANQQRLLGNNYVELTRAELRGIFAKLY